MFTQNQVRQFYVANAYQAAASGLADAGDINVGSQLNDVYFNFVNADGEKMRTDLIDKNKIISVTFTPADKQKYVSTATYIELSNEVIDGGKPKSGEDYILNIKINQLNWHSDESYGWKYGVVHTTSSTTKSDFYKTLASSLVANLSRDPEQLLKIYAVTASGQTADSWNWASTGNYKEIKADSDIATGDTFYAVILDEAEQAWSLGKLSQEPVYYEAKSDDIVGPGGEDAKWGVEKRIPGNTIIQNGKKIADMEWFYHGERGDIYREGAWPNNWKNDMLANKNQKYDTLDIHYYWNGANHAVQKSEKDITIAFLPAASGIVAGFVNQVSGAVPAITSITYATGDVKTVVVD